MARHDEIYKGIRFIVDTVDAGGQRCGFQAVVDGKRPLIGIPCPSEAEAMAQGIAAARAKIDAIMQAYGR